MRKTSTPTATTTTTTTTSSFCLLTRLNHAASTVRATRFTSRTRTPLFPISPWPAAAPRPASVAMDSHGPPLPDDDVDGPPLHAFMRPGAAAFFRSRGFESGQKEGLPRGPVLPKSERRCWLCRNSRAPSDLTLLPRAVHDHVGRERGGHICTGKVPRHGSVRSTTMDL